MCSVFSALATVATLVVLARGLAGFFAATRRAAGAFLPETTLVRRGALFLLVAFRDEANGRLARFRAGLRAVRRSGGFAPRLIARFFFGFIKGVPSAESDALTIRSGPKARNREFRAISTVCPGVVSLKYVYRSLFFASGQAPCGFSLLQFGLRSLNLPDDFLYCCRPHERFGFGVPRGQEGVDGLL